MIDVAQWERLRYHPEQYRLWNTKARRVACAAARGSGKTTLARRKVVAWLGVHKPNGNPNPMYFYAMPTYKKAKRTAWKVISRLIPRQWLAAPLNNNLVARTVFGSELHVVGLDKPQIIESDQWAGGVIDEASDCREEWPLSVMPALTRWNAWLWVIGVPKRTGWGIKTFRKIYFDDAWDSYTWKSESVLTPEAIAEAKKTLSGKDYREQYEASWETAGGAAFYEFDKQTHVRKCAYHMDRTIIVGMDFNVNPMAWVLMHQYDDRVEVFDELYIHDTNTRSSLDVMWSRYQHHQGGWFFYPDASSKARKTSSSSSDLAQLRNDKRFNAVVRVPNANPPVKDRFASCNMMLRNAAGEVRVHIDPHCVNLIDDLESRALDDTGHPTDKQEVGHITDAFGYPIHAKFPVLINTRSGGAAVGTAA